MDRLDDMGKGGDSRRLTNLRGTVDVLDVEDAAQPVQQHLGQSRHQLSCGHQHVHTIVSENYDRKTFLR